MKTLGEILKKELEIYESELKLVKAKVKIIEHDDVKALEEITKEEEKIVSYILELEEKRISLLSEKKYKNISEYLASMDEGNEKEDILLLKRQLLDVIAKIKVENATAEQLISISNGVLSSIIKLATGNKEYGYQRDRQKKEVTQNNLLNKKI